MVLQCFSNAFNCWDELIKKRLLCNATFELSGIYFCLNPGVAKIKSKWYCFRVGVKTVWCWQKGHNCEIWDSWGPKLRNLINWKYRESKKTLGPSLSSPSHSMLKCPPIYMSIPPTSHPTTLHPLRAACSKQGLVESYLHVSLFCSRKLNGW